MAFLVLDVLEIFSLLTLKIHTAVIAFGKYCKDTLPTFKITFLKNLKMQIPLVLTPFLFFVLNGNLVPW